MNAHRIHLADDGDPIIIMHQGEESVAMLGNVAPPDLEEFFITFFHSAPEVIEPLTNALRRYNCPDS